MTYFDNEDTNTMLLNKQCNEHIDDRTQRLGVSRERYLKDLILKEKAWLNNGYLPVIGVREVSSNLNRTVVVVQCPYCGQEHRHEDTLIGRTHSHCINTGHVGEYWIIPDKEQDEIEELLRDTRSMHI